MSEIYVVNQTESNLTLKAGYLHIPRGGYGSILEEDKSELTIKDAYSKGWIKFSETKPTASSIPPVPAIEFVNPNQGMTAEELKASLEADAGKPDSIGTSQALGQGGEVSGEATTTKLGEDTAEKPAKAKSKKAAE